MKLIKNSQMYFNKYILITINKLQEGNKHTYELGLWYNLYDVKMEEMTYV